MELNKTQLNHQKKNPRIPQKSKVRSIILFTVFYLFIYKFDIVVYKLVK